jgi:hypothetical protein
MVPFTWRISLTDPFSLVFIAYICNSLINVLKIAWLQYQTAQPLWPTRLEKDYQDPRDMHMIIIVVID